MFKGIVFALAACIIWGPVFIIPKFMEGFSSIEIALGRYLFFGVISLFLFAKQFKKYPLPIWKKAFLYSTIFAIGYYPLVVLGVRCASPAACALITGISPITIALYGNWKEKECSFKSLIFPSLLIFAGLLLVNGPTLGQTSTSFNYFLGLGACFGALITWSWFVVVNARFLKNNTEIKSSEWVTLNGVCVFIFVMLSLIIAACTETLDFKKYITFTPNLGYFLLGTAFLGVICSWVGTFLWNRSFLYLPVSLVGQLTIFDTIFGLLFIYLLEQRLPLLGECGGIILFLTALIYAIKQFSSKQIKEI